MLALEGVMEVILFTFCILDADVVGFRNDPFIGIGIFYLANKCQTFNRSRAVNWLIVE